VTDRTNILTAGPRRLRYWAIGDDAEATGRLPRHYDLSLLDDPLAGTALKFYMLLTEMSDLLMEERLTPEQVFWSRYYWFLLFTRLRQASAGHDAGLEQQAIRILAHPPPGCIPDWSVLEGGESAVEQDVAAILRSEAQGSDQ